MTRTLKTGARVEFTLPHDECEGATFEGTIVSVSFAYAERYSTQDLTDEDVYDAIIRDLDGTIHVVKAENIAGALPELPRKVNMIDIYAKEAKRLRKKIRAHRDRLSRTPNDPIEQADLEARLRAYESVTAKLDELETS